MIAETHIKKIILVSMLSALVFLSKALFIATPQIKPVSALVIIIGICFGKKIGLLVGVVSNILSGLLFGFLLTSALQGLCFGMMGFFSGKYFKGPENIKKNRLIIFAIIMVALYGITLNIILGVTLGQCSVGGILTYMMVSLPFDIVHILSTVFFLLVSFDRIVFICSRFCLDR